MTTLRWKLLHLVGRLLTGQRKWSETTMKCGCGREYDIRYDSQFSIGQRSVAYKDFELSCQVWK